MGSLRKAAAIGRATARDIVARLGRELRIARIGNGLSQRGAAEAAGMSHSQFGRIERGENPGLTVEQAARAALAVGMTPAAQLYPHGDAARDAPQQRLLDRLRLAVSSSGVWSREVPLPIPGDRRAWDATLRLEGRLAGIEAESKLFDIQAMERRLALKLRDGGVDMLIVVIANTRANRAMLDGHRASLRTLLPLDTADVLRYLRIGKLPPSNGLVVI